MSRLTLENIFKVAVAVFFFPFLPLLVLMIGIRRKNVKVILEGALYVACILAVTAGATSFLFGTFVVLGIIAISGMRSYQLRDLWLHPRARGWRPFGMTPPPEAGQAGTTDTEGAPAAATRELSQALSWSASLAKRNRNRLPEQAYASVLETCRTLDSVIAAEARQPSGDPEFEYELSATVQDYLPSVLRSYLAIPSTMVNSTQATGRTPNQELTEQLQLLSGQAEMLHARRHRRSSADLTTTGNFLRERFSHGQGGYDFGIK